MVCLFSAVTGSKKITQSRQQNNNQPITAASHQHQHLDFGSFLDIFNVNCFYSQQLRKKSHQSSFSFFKFQLTTKKLHNFYKNIFCNRKKLIESHHRPIKYSFPVIHMNQLKLDYLPSECIVLVLKHLSPNDLDNVRLVNHRFNQIIESNVKRLPKYKIESIVKRDFDSDNYFIHHSLIFDTTRKTISEKYLRKCEISKIIFDNPDILFKETINKWNGFRLLENLISIEFRGSNWEILCEILGPFVKNVKNLDILDLTCTSSLHPLTNFPACDIVQILGCKNSFHELQTFIKEWKITYIPKLFQEITLCFGTNRLENIWSQYYPSFSITHDFDKNIKLEGKFIENNCLQLKTRNKTHVQTMGVAKKVFIKENFIISQNDIVVDNVKIHYDTTFLTIQSKSNGCFAVNICTDYPDTLCIQPSTFILHGSQNIQINVLDHTNLVNNKNIYFEISECLGKDDAIMLHSIFLSDSTNNVNIISFPLCYSSK